MSNKKGPFIWESAYNNPSAWQEVSSGFGCQLFGLNSCQGMFQGQLIAWTFLEHIQVINTVDTKYHVQEKPIGALIYAKKEVIDLEVDGEVVKSESDDDDLLNPQYDIIPQDVKEY